jgi:predicted pyridoxine 5'-phosphate oxidase superfamily flavin-nucleotide-binding protein
MAPSIERGPDFSERHDGTAFTAGATGFVKAISPSTLAFADFHGNRQYITPRYTAVDLEPVFARYAARIKQLEQAMEAAGIAVPAGT